MTYQTVFQRNEIKYLLTRAQKQRILEAIAPYMELDCYGRSVIRNIYFDTDSYRLIRRSMERPLYKEKLRVRSYSRARSDSTVFVELKKKYKSVVYKRRVPMPEEQAMAWLTGAASPPDSQIGREIACFRQFYGALRPSVFLACEREAYYMKHGGDFRVTFDENILARQQDLSLTSEVWGTPLLDEDHTLMEIKCAGGIPLWMTRVLTAERIFKASFSKYGKAYETLIYPNIKSVFQTKECMQHGSNFSGII